MNQTSPLYRSLAATVGIGLGAAALLLLIAMLRLLVGPFEISARPEAARALRVGLWEPESGDVEAEVPRLQRRERWRAVLPPGAELETARRLESLVPEIAVIAVANAEALSEAELVQLGSWVENGGSALLAGWVAAPDGGDRRGALARALGVERAGALRREAARFVTAGARGPLSSGVAARIALAGSGALPLLERDGEIAWSDSEQGSSAGAASYRAQRGKGRLVWLAFEPSAVPVDDADRGNLKRIYRNAFAWAAGEPIGELSTSLAGEVEFSMTRSGPYRVQLAVTNRSEQPAADLVVRVYPNRALGEVRAGATMLFRAEPEVRVDEQHVDLLLPALQPGASRDYALDLLPPAGS